MKYTLLFLFFILFLASCKKEEKTSLYMSGYIYNNCYDRIPLQNSAIRLFRTNGGSNQQGEVVATDSTDANGFFKIYFPSAHNANWMKLQTSGGGDLMIEIPPDKNCDSVKVFYNSTCSIRVKLNVINSYTNSDTLFITDYNNISVKLKVPGPFTSGELYLAPHFGMVETYYQNSPMNIGYKINSGNWIIKYFFINPCQLSEVTADIN